MSLDVSSNQERERQQRQQQEQQQALVRSRLVTRLLQPTPDIRQFLHDLVHTQAIVIAGTEAAAFLLVPNEQGQMAMENIAHIRPDSSTPDVRQAALKAFADITAACIKEGKDGAVEVGNTDGNWEAQYCLVTLLRIDTRIVAATAVITRCKDDARAQQRLDIMQVVAGYFDFYTLRRNTELLRAQAQNHQDVLQYAAAISTSEGFQNGVNNVCNELATRTGATRVSVGWVYGFQQPKIKLKGLSHTEQFDKKQELSVQITKAMEECFDQEEIVQFDPEKEGSTTQNVSREAQALSRMEGGNRVVSLPMRHKGEIVGVMSLEFPRDKKPTDHETTGLAVAAELLGPVLYDRHANDRWLITKAGISTLDTWKMAIGPKYWLAKSCVGLLLIALWALCGGYLPYWKAPYHVALVKPMYTVNGEFSFVPDSESRRVVTAGVEGTLESIERDANGQYLRAGSPVKKDQILFRFNDDELQTKLIAAQKRMDKAMAERQALLNSTDREGKDRTAEAMVKQKEADEANAEVQLVQQQLLRTTVRAPIDGMITQGDLSDRIGSQVKLGEQLLEISRTDQLRVEIKLKERDIQRVAPGSVGVIKTASSPEVSHPIKVERVVPSGEAREGDAVFTVYATYDASKIDPATLAKWKPGMAGEAAIDFQPATLMWRWTHRLVDYVRLKFWFV